MDTRDQQILDLRQQVAEGEQRLAVAHQRIAEGEQRLAVAHQRIAEGEQRLAVAHQRIAELEGKVDTLTKLVDTLMTQLNRNSHNSHLPPSSDGPGARGGKAPKAAGKKARGGQPGHRGRKRDLLAAEKVTRVIELYPKECGNCWKALPQVKDVAASRYQVIEIPEIAADVTEYRRNSTRCTCGYTTRADIVGVVPSSPFGPRLMSVIGVFTGVYHLSHRQATALLSDLLGVQISLGALSAVEQRVSAAIADPVDEVRRAVESAPVKHADATSWLQSGKLKSLWTVATPTATLFKVLTDGSAETVKPLFGACTGILVSDRATVFSFWDMPRRQICWAHLLRKFVSFAERGGDARKYGQALCEATGVLFKYWKDFQRGALERETFCRWMTPLQTQIETRLQAASDAGIKELSGSCSNILEHKAALWTYTEDIGVDPTNNHAERELRAFVLWRKRSFGSQSERGNLFATRMMTVAHTARKIGKNVLAFVTACCRAWVEKRPCEALLFSPA